MSRRLLLATVLLAPVAIYAVTQTGEVPSAASLKPADLFEEMGKLGLEREPQGEQLYLQALERLDQRLQLHPLDHEASLLKGLIQFRAGMLDEALEELTGLTEREPKFHLAHLVLGDLRLASTKVISDIGKAPLLLDDPDSARELARLREEAEVRLRAYLDGLPQGRVPRALLNMAPSVHTAIVVDKHTHRLYVYERGEDGTPQLVRDLYVSTGRANGNKYVEGDLRTPEGVYFITRHIPGAQLPDLYGYGAWPMNYPNEWDRHQGKTGHGIWLHGTEHMYYSRPPLDSEGCVVLPNLDLQAIEHHLHPGSTPIIVSERVAWLEDDQWLKKRDSLVRAIEQWRRDWASNDVERYLAHYAEGFWTREHDLHSWKAYKRGIASRKEWQQVELSELSLFAYPSEASQGKTMVVANFRQDYDSNNFRSSMRKRLYLVEEDGQWRIVYEGAQ